MVNGPQLTRCIFCGGDDISQEHLVADWALRGYAKSKRPNVSTAWFLGSRLVAISDQDPVLRAGVTCHACNHGFIKDLDDAAARVLKPLIRGEARVELSPGQQTAVASWIFKTALVCDAAQNGVASELGALRQQFADGCVPPPGCVICAGAAPAPIAGRHRAFGLRKMNGTIRVA